MVDRKQDLTQLSDEVWVRLAARFAGLTDDEYFWEPAPGCWNIRSTDEGASVCDGAVPPPDPAPLTTIAWRLWHLIDMYGENRAPEWLQVPPQGEPIGLDDPAGAPPSCADDALRLLRSAHGRWDAHLALVDDESLGERIGPVGGQYADHTRGKYVLHMLDEFIHHAAEISLLRDLWRWQHPIDADPVFERVIRGDVSVVESVAGRAPEVLEMAAAYARWDIVVALVDAGASPNTGGCTPLHRAAIVGRLDVVQLLVDHGADLHARDPQFDATPLTWARYRGRDDTANWLEEHGAT